MMRLFRSLFALLVFAAALWLAGLAVFVEHVKTLDAAVTDPDPAPVDAIVVLTGGSERLRTGIDLLKEGKARKLFISGVHPGLTQERVLSSDPVPDDLRNCCIILGHAAESTEGNAEETQTWLALENYHSLRLVTANYHMPRSLLLFRALLPDIAIVAHPITPESVRLDSWWLHSGTVSLLVTEFNKYIGVRLQLAMGLL